MEWTKWQRCGCPKWQPCARSAWTEYIVASLLSDPMGRPIMTAQKRKKRKRSVSERPQKQRTSARALLDRSKRSERANAKWLQKYDGPDPRFKMLVTSTGRIGHVTNIQADMLSLHYLGENKNEIIPKKWLKYWQKINARATEWGKDAVLVLDPPRENRDSVDPALPNMHIITPARHAELLRKEREYDASRGE